MSLLLLFHPRVPLPPPPPEVLPLIPGDTGGGDPIWRMRAMWDRQRIQQDDEDLVEVVLAFLTTIRRH